MKEYGMKQYYTEDELKNLYNVDIERLRYRREHGLIQEH